MTAWLLIAPGALVALGVCLVVAGFRPRHARLADALGVLADDVPAPTAAPESEAAGLDRLGAWWVRRRYVVAQGELQRNLRLRGRTLATHYTHKLLAALAGLVAPFLFALLAWVVFDEVSPLPLVAGPVLAAAGFFVPDFLLRGASPEATEDATEALLTFFDLVTLERLANQSGTQALHSAASLSDVPVFAAIRGALDRARLQQRAPYGDIKELGRDLDLPALRDLADVMKLDESGASLSTALRARVRELRDGHLSAMKMTANEMSERMTTWMVIPTVVFGLFFLIPPLLTLVTGG